MVEQTLEAGGIRAGRAGCGDAGPMPGCISRKDAATVTIPTINAGPIDGRDIQPFPQILVSSAAYAMPVS